ncbi:MAG: hypothetical protein HN366_16095 [Deltaproteobacteria bacterium]|nr:hypothetical protein [Deltaproteobacteria bacterium]
MEAAEVVGEGAKAAVPGSATAAVPAREKAKVTVPKTGPAPENVPRMVRVMARDLVKAKRMVQAKDLAAALEEATVSGLRDGLPRSHTLRGNVPGTRRVRLVERGKAIAGQNGHRLNKLIFIFLPASPPQSDRPIRVVWRLQYPMPVPMFEDIRRGG